MLNAGRKTDTIRVGKKNIAVTELTRREILLNIDKLKKKGLTDTEIDELWFYSKR